MSSKIHPTAIIDSSAEIDKDAEIGPYCIVGKEVKIGAGTVLRAHSQVMEYTTIGKNNEISPNAILGGAPQDLGYKGEATELFVGDNNIFREYVTINRGSTKQDKKTVIGNNNLFMAYSHIGHDGVVGDNCVFTNLTQLAGHCHVQNNVIFSAAVLAHQFVTFGERCFIAGNSIIRSDCLPGVLYEGNTARPRVLNLVGLKRAGYQGEELRHIKKAFKYLCKSNMTILEAITTIEGEEWANEEFIVKMLNQAKIMTLSEKSRSAGH